MIGILSKIPYPILRMLPFSPHSHILYDVDVVENEIIISPKSIMFSRLWALFNLILLGPISWLLGSLIFPSMNEWPENFWLEMGLILLIGSPILFVLVKLRDLDETYWAQKINSFSLQGEHLHLEMLEEKVGKARNFIHYLSNTGYRGKIGEVVSFHLTRVIDIEIIRHRSWYYARAIISVEDDENDENDFFQQAITPYFEKIRDVEYVLQIYSIAWPSYESLSIEIKQNDDAN